MTLKQFEFKIYVLVMLMICADGFNAKLTENKTTANNMENVFHKKISGSASLLFADELKITLEQYLFGICPQNYKYRWLQTQFKTRNGTTTTSACDADEQDLAGKLAALSLRAHTASRAECLKFGTVLANTLGELARTAARRQSSGSISDANKKRKMSKSQKLKIQAKQRTALAVKKKAAAVAAAAASKITS